jgi:hypothetical protein
MAVATFAGSMDSSANPDARLDYQTGTVYLDILQSHLCAFSPYAVSGFQCKRVDSRDD